ncbi:hypothetical protein LEMLEM_LOCUS23897, partial [Lemmus lemmus]
LLLPPQLPKLLICNTSLRPSAILNRHRSKELTSFRDSPAAHENEPVKQKDKENNTAGKRSTIFPMQSFPAPSRSSERRETD